MAFIEVKEVSFTYAGADAAIFSEFTLSIEKGECVAVVGPSGCGKSTLAAVMAGYQKPDKGSIKVNGCDVTGRPSRKVFLLAQESDLFPWQTVEKHLLFVGPEVDSGKVAELLNLTNLSGNETKYPHELSGGMKKRLSLARAMAVMPDLIIFDETFSSLDQALKVELFSELKKIWEKTKSTILLISHDDRDISELTQRKIQLPQKQF